VVVLAADRAAMAWPAAFFFRAADAPAKAGGGPQLALRAAVTPRASFALASFEPVRQNINSLRNCSISRRSSATSTARGSLFRERLSERVGEIVCGRALRREPPVHLSTPIYSP